MAKALGPPAVIEAETAPLPEAEVAPQNAILTIGLYAACTYLISGYATDLSYRFLGTKPYLSMVSGLVLFACFVLSGNANAALRTKVGKLWLALGLWMCLATAFRQWRAGSLETMMNYIPKQHVLVFCMAAVAVTVRNCRTVVRACILGSFVLIVTCFFFGAPEPQSGRFVLTKNPLLSNPNDLAMQLVMAIGFFLFWIRDSALVARVAGIPGLFIAGYYLLKTGSRGGLLAAATLILLWIVFSERRLVIACMSMMFMLFLLVLTPQQTLHRLSLILLKPDEALVTTTEEEKTVSSQMAREYLFWKSIEMAVHHPVFGVGPSEFSDVLESNAKREGRHESNIGTHNTYTQFAAECGTPSLLFFVSAIFIVIRSSYRLYRATVRDPARKLVSSLAFTSFTLTVAYSVNIFFHHMAYYGSMPLFMGLWVSLELATRRLLKNPQPAVKPEPAAAVA